MLAAGRCFLLGRPWADLLVKTCVNLTAESGLEYSQLQVILTLSTLTCPELSLRAPGVSQYHEYDEDDEDTNIVHDKLLTGLASLWQLQRLKVMHLAVQPRLLSVLSQLVLLRSLSLGIRNWAHQDLSTLTQIETLAFKQMSNRIVPLVLPQGNNVMLQHLKLDAICNLHGLEALSRLKSIAIHRNQLYTYVGNIAWPSQLPHIEEIRIDSNVFHNSHYTLPKSWQSYPSLRNLTMPGFTAPDLPSWVSALQQLQMLDISKSNFALFPPSLTLLCSLQNLKLDGIRTCLTWDVLGPAALPHLTYLSFGYMVDEDNLELIASFPEWRAKTMKRLYRHEVAVLLQLTSGLATRQVPLHKIRIEAMYAYEPSSLEDSYDLMADCETS